MRKTKYKAGDYVGPHDLLFLGFSKRTDKNGKHKWGLYQCPDCHNVFEARNAGVHTGETKRCKDCLRKWRSENSAFKELNKKYQNGDRLGPNNILLIETRNKQNNFKEGFARFKCPICGKEDWITRIADVAKGKSIKCPDCRKQEKIECITKSNLNRSLNITNMRFGNLTAIYPVKGSHGKDRKWHCVCDCGNTCDVETTKLINHMRIDCGNHNTASNGEKIIQEILTKNNINFKTQYYFDDCINVKTNRYLKFDFYLPDYNCCIEYDGEHHFQEVKFYRASFEDVKYRDSIKNTYCQEHEINLIRIPYWDYDKLNEEYLLSLINDIK